MTLAEGEIVTVRARTGRKWPAVVLGPGARRGMVEVLIEGDPISCLVPRSSCTSEGKRVSSQESFLKHQSTRRKSRAMATEKRSEARELRSQAKALGISDFQNMTRAELKGAIEAAKAAEKAPRKRAKKPAPKAATKTAPAAKKVAKATKATKSTASATTEDNPFRKGSDRHIVFGLLAKGGTRRTLATKLREKIPELRGESGLTDYDKRVTLVAQTLRDEHGFEIIREGRGLDGTIKVVPNGSAKKKVAKKG